MKKNHKKILVIAVVAIVAYALLRKKATGATVVENESGLAKVLSLPADILEAAKTRLMQQKKVLTQDYDVAASALAGAPEGQARAEAEARLKSVTSALNNPAFSSSFNPLA